MLLEGFHTSVDTIHNAIHKSFCKVLGWMENLFQMFCVGMVMMVEICATALGLFAVEVILATERVCFWRRS